jgi:hypothetical protein
MNEYIGRLQGERDEKAKTKAAKSSSTEAGLAIRQRALEGQKRKSASSQDTSEEKDGDENGPKKKVPAIPKSPAITYLELTTQRQDEKDQTKQKLLERQIEQEDLRRIAAKRAHRELMEANATQQRLQREFQAEQLQLQRDAQAQMLMMQQQALEMRRETTQQNTQMMMAAINALMQLIHNRPQ